MGAKALLSQFFAEEKTAKAERFSYYQEQLDFLLNKIYHIKDLGLKQTELVHELPKASLQPYCTQTECATYLMDALKKEGFFVLSLENSSMLFVSWARAILTRTMRHEKEQKKQVVRDKSRNVIELHGNESRAQMHLKLTNLLLTRPTYRKS